MDLPLQSDRTAAVPPEAEVIVQGQDLPMPLLYTAIVAKPMRRNSAESPILSKMQPYVPTSGRIHNISEVRSHTHQEKKDRPNVAIYNLNKMMIVMNN